MLAMPPGSALPLAMPCGSARCHASACRRQPCQPRDESPDDRDLLGLFDAQSSPFDPPDAEALTAAILARLRREGLLPASDTLR
jgi:hypothetical protein